MPRKFVWLVVGGVVVLGVVGYLVSPLFYDRVVDEAAPVMAPSPSAAPVVVAAPSATTSSGNESPPAKPSVVPSVPSPQVQGTFVGLAGHRAQGTATRLQSEGQEYVRFEPDFFVTNGPDLFVYLGQDGVIDLSKRLGPLKGNKGSQNYQVPAAWRGRYNEVWVWCRAFSVSFARASFHRDVRK